MMKCKTNGVDWGYFDKFSKIINELMPDNGEGETVASQIATAINKLVYKWYNDGDVFDNTHYLDGWWNDLSSYANWLYKHVPETRSILNTIEDAKTKEEYEILLKDLADKCLTNDFLDDKRNLAKIESIYECGGKFVYKDDQSEEDGWDGEDEM